MPRYVYECKSCGIVTQVSHSIKERLEQCKSCDDGLLHRLPSMPFVFKNTDKGVSNRVNKYIEDAKEDLEESVRYVEEYKE